MLRMRMGLLMSLIAVLSVPAGFAESLPPLSLVPQLDPQRYVGRWYEIARYQQIFEKDLVGVTAEYALRPDGQISVRNSGFKKTLDGNLSIAKALAWIPDKSKPSALKVQFFWPFAADYLVFGLDEVDYQWALVGDNSRQYLWFLSRTPTIDPALFEKMKTMAESQGYDLANLVIVPQKERMD